MDRVKLAVSQFSVFVLSNSKWRQTSSNCIFTFQWYEFSRLTFGKRLDNLFNKYFSLSLSNYLSQLGFGKLITVSWKKTINCVTVNGAWNSSALSSFLLSWRTVRGCESRVGGRGRVGGDLRWLPQRWRIYRVEFSIQNYHWGTAQIKIKNVSWKWGTNPGVITVCYLASKMIRYSLLQGHSITDGNLNVFMFCLNTSLIDRPIHKITVSFCLPELNFVL